MILEETLIDPTKSRLNGLRKLFTSLIEWFPEETGCLQEAVSATTVIISKFKGIITNIHKRFEHIQDELMAQEKDVPLARLIELLRHRPIMKFSTPEGNNNVKLLNENRDIREALDKTRSTTIKATVSLSDKAKNYVNNLKADGMKAVQSQCRRLIQILLDAITPLNAQDIFAIAAKVESKICLTIDEQLNNFCEL